MDIAQEIYLAERPVLAPLHATRSSTSLPSHTISEEYRDLMAANRIPEIRRVSEPSMVWDEYDLRQAQMEPEFEEAHEEALQSGATAHEDDLDTSCLLYTSDAADE